MTNWTGVHIVTVMRALRNHRGEDPSSEDPSLNLHLKTSFVMSITIFNLLVNRATRQSSHSVPLSDCRLVSLTEATGSS